MKFRKKPVVIDAIRWNGLNASEVLDFIGYDNALLWSGKGTIEIHTLEGKMTASEGDWIIKGIQGEFYPCKPDIFEATYEPVEVKP